MIALAVFMAYQNLENNVISPAIVGKAVNLSPPTTMLAALAGAAAAGVPGALVATPLLGAVKAIYLDRRGEMPEPEDRAGPRAGDRHGAPPPAVPPGAGGDGEAADADPARRLSAGAAEPAGGRLAVGAQTGRSPVAVRVLPVSL